MYSDSFQFLKKEIEASGADIRCVVMGSGESPQHRYDSHEYDAALHYPLFSVTKSIVSIAFGLVYDRLGPSVLERKILQDCTEIPIENPDPRRSELSYHHLLSQTSGIKWREMGAKWGSGNPLWDMEHHHEWMSFILNREFSSVPGRHFNYSSGVSHLLPYLMGKLLEGDICDILLEDLFFPLGIDRLEWESDPQGNLSGGKGLSLRAEDLWKFGSLVAQEGKFRGRQVVSAEWIRLSTAKKARGLGYYGDYGYQWWIQSPEVVAAIGFGGQYLFIDKSRGLVAVFLGNLNKASFDLPRTLFEKLRK
jgi:CubicO group peptidase (beta-lactamase class C family)